MDGSENTARVVTAKLPSGAPIRIEVLEAGYVDGITNVGLQDFDLNKALDTVAEIGSVMVDKLKAAKPTRATVELKLGFAIEAGKLTALWVGGKADAALTMTLEWTDHTAAPVSEDA